MFGLNVEDKYWSEIKVGITVRNVDGISRDQKIPGLRNPGILIPEKSQDKKSRD